jgi:putative DNA primase/helicase
LAGKSQNDLAKALRSGGWIFKGYKGVCVKPNSPRRVKDENGKEKIIKYESPRGAGNQQIFIPCLSVRAGLEIATKMAEEVEKEYRQRIELLSPDKEDPDFWDWYLEHEGFIIITEGAKKACSLVSNGYPAIGLNGIWGWGTNDRDMFGNIEKDDRGKSLKNIHPDLEPFLDGREIVLALDRDANPTTARRVDNAKASLVRTLDGEGIPISDLKWRSPKGVDDYIAAKGVKAFDRLYTNRKSIKVKPIPSQDDESIGFQTDRDRGLVLLSEVDGETRSKQIGNHLEAIGYVNNPTQDGAALLLEFKTIRGHIRRWTMPRADLAGDGASIIAQLLSRDYSFNRKQKAALLDYLFSLGQQIDRTYTVTDASGWVDKSFVLPHKTYGDESLRFRDVDPAPDAISQIGGTLEGWIDNVASRCGGNSRLILSLGASFAAPLLPLIGIESGGFHLLGGTSQGKTTILSVAASVTGIKDIPHWRTTTNGLESIATAFNHLCLPLDEIGQADPRDVGNIAYMLANGQGKARMKRDLTNRQSKTWQLMVLSSGEVGMGSYMQQAGIAIKGGQEVRLPDIPAIPEGSKYGCFETIHGADTAVQFVGALEAAVKEHYGTALDAFLSRLVVDATESNFTGNFAKQTHLIAAKLAEGTSDSAIGRVAKRFALVQVALGLAHQYGLLPFPVEQIEWSISNCFNAWLNARGGDGSIEIKRAIDNLKHVLTINEFSDRVLTIPSNNERRVHNLLAYRTLDPEGQTQEFLVPSSVFDREFCNGVNKSELVRELQRLGLMLPPRSDGKSVYARRVNGKQDNFYVFPRCENAGDASDAGDAPSPNPVLETLSDTSPLHHQDKTIGDAGDAPPPLSLPLHHLHHQGKMTGDADINIHNPDTATDTITASPASPASPPKTQLGNFSKFKVGERVRFCGDSESLLNRMGAIVDFDRASVTYQVDWDGDYSGRTWFVETELEAFAERPQGGIS